MIGDDLYMIPDLERLEREGVLAPFSDKAIPCLSGRRYPNAGKRGFTPWSLRQGSNRSRLLPDVLDILNEYDEFLPLTLGKYITD